MIRAYSEFYLSNAMKNLGAMFDFAVNYCRHHGDKVLSLFISTGLAGEFQRGNPKYIAGLSGQELFYEILSAAKKNIPYRAYNFAFNKSAEYWCGWILAYYQWFYNSNFEEIHARLAFQDLLNLYPALHEADRQKAIEVLHKRITAKSEPTKLQVFRKASGLSQASLALLSGVSLRSIQMYEQRNKDINKAQAATLRALGKSLCRSIEELLD